MKNGKAELGKGRNEERCWCVGRYGEVNVKYQSKVYKVSGLFLSIVCLQVVITLWRSPLLETLHSSRLGSLIDMAILSSGNLLGTSMSLWLRQQDAPLLK